VQQVWSYQVHANKESVSTFSLDKLEKIHRSYKAEIKIKTILNHILEAKAIAQLKYLIIMM
jgi:hypothetical protein